MRQAIALLLAFATSGCILDDPNCVRGAGPSDCSFHFQGAYAGASFASAWNATRVAAAMRETGWTDAQAASDGSYVAAASVRAGNAMGNATGWWLSVTYEEGFGPREVRADPEARLNASMARHVAELDKALSKFEAALGESHVGNVTWQPLVAIE